ncbi:glycine oxidase ThiO [Paenibacillus lycopersici]|uniref:glycine oxidase n=1 Tax=Paenibacillus lycopersici TaxID=2704462 RepID=A0A6C0G5R9_9BACL|nr:glycine oxidase ThiO [Paenibacillus lycopersici]QHT63561.1 glycine oxidase ThiO [Paenibacillus lycopersici]
MSRHIVILGGGIIGLSCAFEAALAGDAVTVVEPGRVGGQASGAAAGMLAPFTENAEQPDAFFRLCLDSLHRYPEWVRAVEEVSGLSAELVASGCLTVALHEADLQPLQARLAWQQRFGASSELVGPERLRTLEPRLHPGIAGALYCPVESHVHAPKLVAALEAACRRLGVRLLEHAGEITPLRGSGGSGGLDGDGAVAAAVETGAHGRISGDALVVCAGAWANAYAELCGFPIPVHPIRGQICAFDLAGSAAGGAAGAGEPERVRHMVFSSQAYWVQKQDGRLICGASEDAAGYDTSVTERGIARLTRWTPRVFPFLDGRNPVMKWAGLRPATRDGWPLIGAVPGSPNVLIAAGHYRNGILLSPATAAMAVRLLSGEEPPVAGAAASFAPDRFAGRPGVPAFH